MFIIFFITYGFIGLEYISMELDDPFGDDPNDFDVTGLCEVVFDDIFIAVHDVDGKAAADVLRKNVNLPLDQLTRNTVKSHQRYSSLGAWQIQGKKGDKSALEKRSFLLNPVDEAHVDKAHVDESPTKEHSLEKQVDKIWQSVVLFFQCHVD